MATNKFKEKSTYTIYVGGYRKWEESFVPSLCLIQNKQDYKSQ